LSGPPNHRQSYNTLRRAAKSAARRSEGWKTPIDFTKRDDLKVKDIKVEEVLDNSVIRELAENVLSNHRG